jgi:hypothetical protein
MQLMRPVQWGRQGVAGGGGGGEQLEGCLDWKYSADMASTVMAWVLPRVLFCWCYKDVDCTCP